MNKQGKNSFFETGNEYFKNLKQAKDKEEDDDIEVLRKLNIPFEDDDDLSTPSLMTIASALPNTEYVDSMGDNVQTKSSSYCDYDAATLFEDDIYYSDYDFDDDEDEGNPCNSKFSFKIHQNSVKDVSSLGKKKYKNGTRASLTFSNQRMKEIERDNRILLNKIMRNGPSGETLMRQQSSKNNQPSKIKSASEINRLRKQEKIIYENQILKQKLDKIASRRTSFS